MSNGTLPSGKTKSSGKDTEEMWDLRRNRMDGKIRRLMIHALIWNSAISGLCLLNVWTAQLDWRNFVEFEAISRNVISRIFQKVTFAKVYLAVIFGMHFGMHLLSRSIFVRRIVFFIFYYLLPVPILFLAANLIP